MMSIKSTPCAWWHQPERMEPLEAVRLTAKCLEAGTVVPPMAASIMARALRQYLEGKHDITGNLGLRPSRGGSHKTALAIERMTKRDEGIKHVYSLQEGNKTERARKVACLLKESPKEGQVTEADVFAYLLDLHREFSGELPTSGRQVLRLVGDDCGTSHRP